MAQPDHPEYNAANDSAKDQAFKDGTWKDDEDIDVEQALEWKFHRVRGILHPEPGEPYAYEEWKGGQSTKQHQGEYGYQRANLCHEYQQVRLEEEFRDRGLQVIVKLASVELTPEKPGYSGGSWHLEVSHPPTKRLQVAVTTSTSITKSMILTHGSYRA
jgi:hypothetical protein